MRWGAVTGASEVFSRGGGSSRCEESAAVRSSGKIAIAIGYPGNYSKSTMARRKWDHEGESNISLFLD